MKLFVSIYNDVRLLGHFLRHYVNAKIDKFYIAIAPEFRSVVEEFASAYSVTIFDDLDVADSILAGAAAITEMRRLCQNEDEWVVVVDLDEFIEFTEDPHALVSKADAAGANVVRGIMHDRFSPDGQLGDIGPHTDLPTTFPVKSRFIRNVMGGCDHKGILVKGHLKASHAAGHHRFEGERIFRQILEISHYKWIAGALDRLRVSHQLIQNAGIRWAAEHGRVFAHFEQHGRFAWEEFDGRLAADFEMEAPNTCADCGAPVSEAEHEFSLKHFGKALCRTDQRSYRSVLVSYVSPKSPSG